MEFTPNDAPIDNISGVFINQDLINYIRNFIRNVAVLEVMKEAPNSQESSQIQMAFTKIIFECVWRKIY